MKNVIIIFCDKFHCLLGKERMKVTVSEEIEIIALFFTKYSEYTTIKKYICLKFQTLSEIFTMKSNFITYLLYNFSSGVHVLIKIYAIVSREKYKKFAIVSRILNLNNIS